jgi:hypothetical protein
MAVLEALELVLESSFSVPGAADSWYGRTVSVGNRGTEKQAVRHQVIRNYYTCSAPLLVLGANKQHGVA